MDFIGTITAPQGVFEFIGVWWLIIVAVVVVAALIVASITALNSSSYNRVGNAALAAFITAIFVGFFGVLGSLFVMEEDAERYAQATVLKIEKDLDLDVLTYSTVQVRSGILSEFTAIDEEGYAVLGRLTYEGDTIYVSSLTRE